MKLSSYLKEKSYVFLITLFICIITTMFLLALDINKQALIVIEFLLCSMSLSFLIIEYLRRANYYTTLNETIENLDQKYLITEIMERPNFLDGKIVYDTLQLIDKSMSDHVNIYKHTQSEYKQYVEMWVHEIKTPLAATKLIISNNPSAINESILEEVEKVEAYVEQALFYARSTTLEKDYLIKDLNLQEVVSKIIRKHSKTFIYRKIKMDLKDIDVQVYSDSKWLEFIIDQIISNSLKYMNKDDKVIHIYTTRDNNSVHLHIQDNGVGIETSEMNRIFDRGFTGKNGRLNEKATGMGLYLCKNLCDKLYLGIHAISFFGQGTTITLDFPISKFMLLK